MNEILGNGAHEPAIKIYQECALVVSYNDGPTCDKVHCWCVPRPVPRMQSAGEDDEQDGHQ